MGTCTRNTVGFYVFFFSCGAFPWVHPLSSSLGFAKSKNGQIEYASTFLEAKPAQARFTLLCQPH